MHLHICIATYYILIFEKMKWKFVDAARGGFRLGASLLLLVHPMKAHLTKNEFKFVAISVMVLEVASFLVFIFGTLSAILGTYNNISTTDFILLGFGGIFVALILMAAAEVLQIMMRIEYNTRKENSLLAENLGYQRAEVVATKSVASSLKLPNLKKIFGASILRRDSRSGVVRSKALRKKAMVKKIKPRKVRRRI